MRIELPLETWMDVLDWLKRKEFAAKLDQLWDREFTRIGQFWLHEYQRNVQLGNLWIRKGADGRAELWDKKRRIVPIAQVEMPDNIRGFSEIYFGFLDSTVLKFLTRMRPIFHNLSLKCLCLTGLNTAITRIAILLDRLQPLINGPIEWMELERQQIPIFFDLFPAVLFNTKVLEIWRMDNQVIELLVNWLFTPREDSQPRVLIRNDAALILEFNHILTTVRQRLVNPERGQASPFFIRLWVGQHIAAEVLESATEHGPTGEQLTVKKAKGILDRYGRLCVLISNCALDDDQKELNEKKVLDLRMHHVGMRNQSTIIFY